MLTSEHEAVDLSTLLHSGLLGLSQSALKLARTAPSGSDDDDNMYEEIGPDGVPYLKRHYGEQAEDDITSKLHIGTRVVRGPDWKWGDQDGPSPGEGTIVSELGSDYWIRVQWDTGAVNSYRMTKDRKYDLTLAQSELRPKTREGESKDMPLDTKLTVGMATPFPARDVATSLLLQSSVCLLRSLVVAYGVHSHQLPQQSSIVLSKLLHYIVQCAKKKCEEEKKSKQEISLSSFLSSSSSFFSLSYFHLTFPSSSSILSLPSPSFLLSLPFFPSLPPALQP